MKILLVKEELVLGLLQSSHIIKFYKANDGRQSLECARIVFYYLILKILIYCFHNAPHKYAKFTYSISFFMIHKWSSRVRTL
jgi:hypothetical protein